MYRTLRTTNYIVHAGFFISYIMYYLSNLERVNVRKPCTNLMRTLII